MFYCCSNLLRRGGNYRCTLALRVSGRHSERKELRRVFGTSISCFKINTAELVPVLNSMDGFVTRNLLVVK
jgi:hypothetical protein